MPPSYITVDFEGVFVEPISLDTFQSQLEIFCESHNNARAEINPDTFIPFELISEYKIAKGQRVYQILNGKTITVEISVSEDERPNWLYMRGISRDWQQFLRYWLSHLMGYLAAKHTATLDRPEISFDPTLSNEISQCGRNLLALSTRILDNSILAMRTNKPLYDQGLMTGHDWGFTKTVSPITSLLLPQPKPVKPADDVVLEMQSTLQLAPAGRKRDAKYNIAFDRIQRGESEDSVYKAFCEGEGIKCPDKNVRDSFKAAIRLRAGKSARNSRTKPPRNNRRN